MLPSTEIVDFTFTWKIDKFTEKNGKRLQSSVFNVNHFLKKTEWHLSLDFYDIHFLGIFLYLNSPVASLPDKSTRIGFTITIVAADISSNISKKITAQRYFNNSGYGCRKVVSLKKILHERHLYLPQDTLTIQCYMIEKEDIDDGFKIAEGDSTTSLQNFNQCTTLCKDLYDLYLDNKFCDIKIRTSDRVFDVHKTVICARSPVFRAMFEDDTQEKNSGVIDIIDIDSHTVSRMLTFMYSDSSEELNIDQAAELYAAADKYCILTLKDKCSTSLKSLLSCANVSDVYVLADMHLDNDLKSAVQNYVYIHAEKVCTSSEWKHFMELQPKLSAQLMHYLFIKQLDVDE